MGLIEDGSGKAYKAEVDSHNRLRTKALMLDETTKATLDGDSYNVNTGIITLTSANESGIMYIKNNETRVLNIKRICVFTGPTTSGAATDTGHIKIYKNVTTGTLVSNATAVDVTCNRNFSSANLLDSDSYKGVEAATITDGVNHMEGLVSPGLDGVFEVDEHLGTTDSIAISYTPPDSNSSIKVMASVACHLVEAV